MTIGIDTARAEAASGFNHLVICHPGPVAAMLSGDKTIESRFAQTKRLPWGRVHTGDTLWIKRTSGPIVAVAIAGRVFSFAGLTPDAVDDLFARFPGIQADTAYRLAKRTARYATIIEIATIHPCEPRFVQHRGRNAWEILPGPPTEQPGHC